MLIRRFTPTAERMLNLIPGDAGRSQINTNLVVADLELLAHETIDTFMPKEIEVQDRSGRWYLLQTVDLMREPVLVLDQILHVKTANQAFYGVFGFTAENTVGRALLELESPQFSSTRLHALAQQLQGLDRPIENVMNDGDESGAHTRLRASGRQFQLGDGKHWTVVTLIPANGQLEKHQPES